MSLMTSQCKYVCIWDNCGMNVFVDADCPEVVERIHAQINDRHFTLEEWARWQRELERTNSPECVLDCCTIAEDYQP